MADEAEKKPEYVLIKKEKTSEAAQSKSAPEKKKVVVVRKKPSASSTTALSTAQKEPAKKNAIRVVAKKAPETSAAVKTDSKVEQKIEPKSDTKADIKTEAKSTPVQASKPADGAETPKASTQGAAAVSTKKIESSDTKSGDTARQQQKVPFELHSARPNVKAGNLSDRSRGRYGNNGGYGRRDGQGGGFTGAQAREGYQNRERENRNGSGY